MTNKNKSQGTSFESKIVAEARALGLPAHRLAEGGSSDGGDVYLGKLPVTDVPYTVLAWRRLVPSVSASSRRSPDGEPVVFVLDKATAMRLIASYQLEYGAAFIIECKATERLNVTRTLARAKAKVNRWWLKTTANETVTGV